MTWTNMDLRITKLEQARMSSVQPSQYDPGMMGWRQNPLDGKDHGQSTLAQGSAAIQDVVYQLEHPPLWVINAFEQQVAWYCGAHQPERLWSSTSLTDKPSEQLPGHVTPKMLRVLCHIYELHRRYPQNPLLPVELGVCATVWLITLLPVELAA